MKKLLVVLFALLLAVASAFAQETRGTISGTVRDAQGVIPGAVVKVTNTGTNVTQEMSTNSRGYSRRSSSSPEAIVSRLKCPASKR